MMGVLERFVTPPTTYRAERLRAIAGVTSIGDNEKAKAELGIEHRPLRDGVRETIRHEIDEMTRR